MSMSRTIYTILGYDFTNIKNDIIPKDWFWSEKGEKYIWNQSEWNIQFFNDKMDGDYLYFGFIVSALDEYDDNKVIKILPSDMENKKKDVDKALMETGLSFPIAPICLRNDFVYWVLLDLNNKITVW